MTNISNIRFRHGVDALQGDAPTPVIINEAEKPALTSRTLEDRNPGQIHIVEVARPLPVAGSTIREAIAMNHTINICSQEN
jgi:hypothetical protein